VHFYGFRQIEENPVFYALADAFVLASLYEEWGLVVNEAMACGLPVVVSATAGCAEDLLVRDWLAAPPDMPADLRMRLAQLTGHIRQNGFSFNPTSVQSLANALIILEGVPEIRENMGQASRRIVERFSCENFATNALLAARAALNHG
jgi:glycosyltransferase involved in cell wall biosynthesis